MIPYDVQATEFQRLVWEWMRGIAMGMTCCYSDVARATGKPTAIQAVARACASNPVALVIPCHRIIAKSGDIGGFWFGIERKQKLLEIEKIKF